MENEFFVWVTVTDDGNVENGRDYKMTSGKSRDDGKFSKFTPYGRRAAIRVRATTTTMARVFIVAAPVGGKVPVWQSVGHMAEKINKHMRPRRTDNAECFACRAVYAAYILRTDVGAFVVPSRLNAPGQRRVHQSPEVRRLSAGRYKRYA